MRRIGTTSDSLRERGRPSSVGWASTQGGGIEYRDPVAIPPQQMGEAPEGFTTPSATTGRASVVLVYRLPFSPAARRNRPLALNVKTIQSLTQMVPARMQSRRRSYYDRVLGALVGVLLLVIVLVRVWPATPEEPASLFRDRPSAPIQVEDVQPTSQSQKQTPPPPAPLPPVVVPDEVLVTEDLDFGEAELRVETPEDDAQLQEGADRTTAARAPDTGARLLRNVQPTYPAAAQEDDVRARVEVEVKIGTQGRVQSATIRKRWRLRSDGSPQRVAELGYGLEDAALAAARRSLFQPARHRGTPVATRTILTFTFGPE